PHTATGWRRPVDEGASGAPRRARVGTVTRMQGSLRHKRILLFIDSLAAGGAQRQMVVLANELHRRGYRVELVAYHPLDQLSQFLSPGVRYDVLARRGRYDIG